eukprot:TRINITY_DN14684_c0_g1_i4.p1 TRINITY_DN14684_c0_g1~~TRINITY_DN14684_c0_g1_i4.p1  ORF type:complete len:195 (-),score=38.80 TRINITY_DN14684_c0_g1_i4:39-623(-)
MDYSLRIESLQPTHLLRHPRSKVNAPNVRSWQSVCRNVERNALCKNRKLFQAFDALYSKSQAANILAKRSSMQLDEFIKENVRSYDKKNDLGIQAQNLSPLNQEDRRRARSFTIRKHRLCKALNNQVPPTKIRKPLSLSPLIRSIQLPNVRLYHKAGEVRRKKEQIPVKLRRMESVSTSSVSYTHLTLPTICSV